MTEPRIRRLAAPVVALVLGLAAGCSKPIAYGSDNAVIAVVDSTLADSLAPVLRRALEREMFTVHPERVFEITFTTPGRIGEFKKWRRIVLVEPLDDAVLVPDLVDTGDDDRPIFTVVHDAWAREQTIWVLAAPTADATLGLVTARADSLYHAIYAAWADHQAARMWASGRDSALATRMLDERRFSILLPKVYRPAPGSTPDSSLVFFSPDPRRVVSLHWVARPDTLAADTVLAIRRSWARQVFDGDSMVAILPDSAAAASDSTNPFPPIQASATTLGGQPAIRLQGVWQNAADHTGGLFLTYGVGCGDRLVLLDGDLYAPSSPKIPYVLQFESIFATFRCAPARTGGMAAGGAE